MLPSYEPVPNYAGRMFQPMPTMAAPKSVPTKHTLHPMVTGTSVVALKYKDGVVMAADTLGSYGSSCMFKSVQRIVPVGEYSILGGSGEYSDFQFMTDQLKDVIVEEREQDDGSKLYPNQIFSLLSQIMYNRRNKQDPLYNQFLLAGYRDGKAFLGFVDKLGTNFEDNHISTGYGAHIAIPLLRKHYRPDLTRDEAVRIVEMCMTVLYYRDKQTINKIQIATIDSTGINIAPPKELPTVWTSMEHPENKKVQQLVYVTPPV